MRVTKTPDNAISTFTHLRTPLKYSIRFETYIKSKQGTALVFYAIYIDEGGILSSKLTNQTIKYDHWVYLIQLNGGILLGVSWDGAGEDLSLGS